MPYMGNTTRKASDIRRFDVTSSTSATHTLSWIAPNEQSLIVTINGVKQHEDSYSTSGAVLTLTSALIATDKLEVIGINDIGTTITPAQNSVDTDKILDDAVTADKLANSINTEIAANTAKVTNATHTGDVTGATALTIASGAVDLAMLSATGTASATTFLRGDNAWAAAGGGKVAQVVSATQASVASTTGTTYVTTGLSASITPSSTSNKVLVFGHINTFYAYGGAPCGAYIALYRDGTVIVDKAGWTYSASSTGLIASLPFHLNDSPSSISSLTYEVYFKKHTGSTIVAQDGGPSYITLMEIEA